MHFFVICLMNQMRIHNTEVRQKDQQVQGLYLNSQEPAFYRNESTNVITTIQKHHFYAQIAKLELKTQDPLQPISIKKNINYKMRNRLGKWLQEISFQTFMFSTATLINGIQILDSYLSNSNEHFSQLQLIGCASLYISSKINQSRIVSGDCYVESSNNIFTKQQLEQKELLILKTLNYQTNYQDPIRLLRFFNSSYHYNQEIMIQLEDFALKCLFHQNMQNISRKGKVISSSIITSVQDGKFIEENALSKILQSFTI